MTTFVVDTSVVVKWFVPEVHSEHAQRLLEADHALHAPSLLTSEFTNVLWKRVESAKLTPVEAHELLEDFLRLPIKAHAAEALAEAALRLSVQGHHAAYDCFYLALALELGCQCVTADAGFLRGFSSAYPDTLLWVEDVPG